MSIQQIDEILKGQFLSEEDRKYWERKRARLENIESAKRKIDSALADLRKLYNEPETSLDEMAKIADYARLLNTTDFEKTITE